MKDKKKGMLLILCVFGVSFILTILFASGVFDNLSLNQEVRSLLNSAVLKCVEEKRNGLVHTSKYTFNNGELTPNLEETVSDSLNGNIIINSKCEANAYWYKDNDYNQCYLSDDVLEIGSTFICNGEEFNVIEFSDSKITLLSKYNINVNNNKQDSSDTMISSSNAISFDESKNRNVTNNTYCSDYNYGCNIYSKSEEIITNGLFIGEVNEDSTVKYYVDNYAMSLKLGDNLIDSGLITKEQLESLGCSIENFDCTASKYSWLYNTTYWTSSPFSGSSSIIWRVQSDGRVGTSYSSYGNNTGIRPIIVIKNNILKTSK